MPRQYIPPATSQTPMLRTILPCCLDNKSTCICRNMNSVDKKQRAFAFQPEP